MHVELFGVADIRREIGHKGEGLFSYSINSALIMYATL